MQFSKEPRIYWVLWRNESVSVVASQVSRILVVGDSSPSGLSKKEEKEDFIGFSMAAFGNNSGAHVLLQGA